MNRSIERRLKVLESKECQEDVTLIVSEALPEEDEHYKESSGYIIDRCEAACDRETYQKVLDDALLSLTGENPLLVNGIWVINISSEVALEVAKNLRALGIEVAL